MNFIDQKITEISKNLGFSGIGVTHLNIPNDELIKYRNWLNNGNNADMEYLENHFQLKSNPNLLLTNAVSIISLILTYRTNNSLNLDQNHGYISIYARGRDYHKVLSKKLKEFTKELSNWTKELDCRSFVDSGPILEKIFAENAGLGVRGKNSILINPTFGSFFFIGEILTNLNLTPTKSLQFSPCEKCNKCIKKCPNNAIINDKQIDARKCISYLTIENKNSIPLEYRKNIGNRIFGCDECQLCCQWNKNNIFTTEQDFENRFDKDFLLLNNLLNLNEESFNETFSGTPIRRTGYLCFMRNVIIASGNSKNKDLIPILNNIYKKLSPMHDELIQWSIKQLIDT